MKVSPSIITFRIDIDFEDCEVDMVLKEMSARGVQSLIVPSILCGDAKIPIDKTKLPKTPTEASVDYTLHYLWGYVDSVRKCTSNSREFDRNGKAPYFNKETELEKIGVEVESIYGLMQGTCHLICSCSFENYSPELVQKATTIVEKTFKKLVKYHK